MDASDETSTSGVSMDIKDARSETSDIESEVPDDETSDSAEAMCCRNRCCWLLLWCSASSWSITVRIVGVGISLNNHWHRDSLMTMSTRSVGRGLNMPSTCLPAELHVKCILFSFSRHLRFRAFTVTIFDFIFNFIFDFIIVYLLPNC
jgi:hypothetical protein